MGQKAKDLLWRIFTNEKTYIIILAILVVGTIAFGITTGVGYFKQKRFISQLSEYSIQYQTEIDGLTKSNAKLKQSNRQFSSANTRLRDSNSKYEQLNSRLQSTNERLRSTTGRLQSELRGVQETSRKLRETNLELQANGSELQKVLEQIISDY